MAGFVRRTTAQQAVSSAAEAPVTRFHEAEDIIVTARRCGENLQPVERERRALQSAQLAQSGRGPVLPPMRGALTQDHRSRDHSGLQGRALSPDARRQSDHPMTWAGGMRRCASRAAMRRISWTDQRISERAASGA